MRATGVVVEPVVLAGVGWGMLCVGCMEMGGSPLSSTCNISDSLVRLAEFSKSKPTMAFFANTPCRRKKGQQDHVPHGVLSTSTSSSPLSGTLHHRHFHFHDRRSTTEMCRCKQVRCLSSKATLPIISVTILNHQSCRQSQPPVPLHP